MRTAPQTTLTPSQVPDEPGEAKEAMLEIFGQHLFWLRNQRLRILRRLLADESSRAKLGTVFRRPFDAMASHGEEAANAAVDFAEQAIDGYMKDLLAMLTNIGDDMRFGPGHSLRYRLVLEVVDPATDTVVREEVINRDTEDWLPGYYGGWLVEYDRYPAETEGGSTGRTAGEDGPR